MPAAQSGASGIPLAHEVERGAEVVHLARPVVERARARAGAAEVEAQHGAADPARAPSPPGTRPSCASCRRTAGADARRRPRRAAPSARPGSTQTVGRRRRASPAGSSSSASSRPAGPANLTQRCHGRPRRRVRMNSSTMAANASRPRDRAEMAGPLEHGALRAADQRGVLATCRRRARRDRARLAVTTSVGAATRAQSARRVVRARSAAPARPSASSDSGAVTSVRSCRRGEPPAVARVAETPRASSRAKPPRRFGEKQRAEEPAAAARRARAARLQVPARAGRRHQDERRRPRRGCARGEAQRDQAAERDAADGRALEPRADRAPRRPDRRSCRSRRVDRDAPADGSSHSGERDHAERRRQRVDGGPHVLPPALNAGDQHERRRRCRARSICTRLSSSAACRSSACAESARASSARRTASGTPRARDRAGAASLTVVAMRQRAAGEDVRERAADQRVVIADAAGAPREVDAELQRGLDALAADRDRLAAAAADSPRARARARAPSRRPSAARGSS